MTTTPPSPPPPPSTPRGAKRVRAEDAAYCQRWCQRAACAIQFCLERHGYQERKCTAAIDAYFDCCEAAKRQRDHANGHDHNGGTRGP